MGRKAAAPAKMNLAELGAKFGIDPSAGALPTHSVGKDFGKGKGKGGLRDNGGDTNDRLNDWGRGGGGKDGGGGKGMMRRDNGPTKADEGDWFAREKPSGGGGFGDRDRDRDGDRGGKGGGKGGGMRRDEGRDDTQAGKDEDWRGGSSRNDGDRGGRGGDRDGGRRGGDDAPPERKRLNLAPRSKPLPEGETPSRDRDRDDSKPRNDPFGSARPITAGGEKEAKPEGDKYIPPSQRKRMEEEANKRRDNNDDRRGGNDDRRDNDDRRRGNDDRRRDNDDRRGKTEDGFETVGGKRGGGGYEAPQKKAENDKMTRKEEEDRERRAAEKKKAQAEEDEKEAAEDLRKAEKAQKKALKKEAKEEEKRAGTTIKKSAGAKKPQMEEESKLQDFTRVCEMAVDDSSTDIEALSEEATSLLSTEELKSIQPVRCVLLPLMKYCREKEDEDVIGAVKRFEPLLTSLIEAAYSEKVHRFKVKVLCEAQKIAHEMGLPRLSAASALVEVFFDGLYQAEIIEEGYFTMWSNSDDNTPGKIGAMFQLQHFLYWLENGPQSEDEEEDDGEEGEEEDAEEDEEEDEEDMSDIEANVPKRAGARPIRP